MRALVVGSGAGGATVAQKLGQNGFDVLVLEAGPPFKPFTRRLSWTKPLRRVGLLGSEKNISRVFKHIDTKRASSELVLFRGLTTGGCTSISCGNIVRAARGLSEIGLDLTSEYNELEKLIDIKPIPNNRWRPVTKDMYKAAKQLGLEPQPTPKAVDLDKCVSCGLCELGCATGARWDSLRLLNDVKTKNIELRTNSTVQRILFEKNKVTGVEVKSGRTTEKLKADVVVLAAGGIGTAQIMHASGLPAKNKLWIDIVLTLGGVYKGANQLKEPPMVWYAKKEDYIISPYIDILSHWFHKPWRKVPLEDRVGVMVKVADTTNGSIDAEGNVRKVITNHDRKRLDEGIDVIKKIYETAGVSKPYVEGMYNGGHLGGTVPLTKRDVPSMRPAGLPKGLWVADLSLIPKAQGMPTMMITAAVALKVGKKITEKVKSN